MEDSNSGKAWCAVVIATLSAAVFAAIWWFVPLVVAFGHLVHPEVFPAVF